MARRESQTPSDGHRPGSGRRSTAVEEVIGHEAQTPAPAGESCRHRRHTWLRLLTCRCGFSFPSSDSPQNTGGTRLALAIQLSRLSDTYARLAAYKMDPPGQASFLIRLEAAALGAGGHSGPLNHGHSGSEAPFSLAKAIQTSECFATGRIEHPSVFYPARIYRSGPDPAGHQKRPFV